MPRSLHNSKIFLVSLFGCVVSSIVINILLIWFISLRFAWNSLSAPQQIQTILFFLGISVFISLFKFLPTVVIGYLVKPSFRWVAIVVSIVALSLLEAWFYYIFYTVPFGALLKL